MSGIFVVIPTPDELLIHPFIGYIYSILFGIDLKTGIIWSIVSYNSLGCLMILAAIIIGGKYVLIELNTQLSAQGRKLGEQMRYNLKTSTAPVSYLSYNQNEPDTLPELKYELFD
jgi:hypothetical protein